jgi:DNA-binding MarR family transcriptional regulator
MPSAHPDHPFDVPSPEVVAPPSVRLPDALSCQPTQMLVRIARQSGLGDPEGCAAVLALLTTSRLVRGQLHRVLAELGLNEAKLTTLITLYALDPEPSTPADLAVQSQVSRSTMTDTLESLHASGWVQRERGESDRRTLHIHLTETGRSLVERAVRPFLTAVGNCADTLSTAERSAVTSACIHLCDHFQPHSA